MAGAEETPSEPLIAPPLVPETRLLCLALSRNGERDALRQAAQWAARAGFNGVITPLLLGGLPTFPSPAPRNYGLPPAIPGFRRRDPLGEIAEAAREAGLRLFGALPLWRPDGNVPPRMVLHWFRRRLDWFARSVRAGGRRARIRPTELAFCPSNSVLRRYLGDLLSEAIEGYPLNGLILQSDGLPHSLASERRGCFCRLCREEARESELDLDDLLGESPPPEAVEAWDAWRIRSARETMAYFAQRGHKARQRLLLLCRTASTKPEDSETDDEEEGSPERLSLRLWRPWVQMGAVEGLALEGLPSDRERFEETLEHNLASWPDDTLLFPVLRSADSAELAERIEVVRSLPMTGFLSEWTGDSTEEAADQLASTCLAPPSLVAEEHPLRSAANLLAEVARLAPADSGISEFLTDILAFAREPSGVSEIEALDAMVDNVRGLEARILGGQVDFGAEERRALHRLSQAKRLARLASHYAGI